MDGKYVYCFSNEHWSAATKEVSFNVHGIVYVPESEVPGDPLEIEGKPFFFALSVSGGKMGNWGLFKGRKKEGSTDRDG